jgi:hypothetical protein
MRGRVPIEEMAFEEEIKSVFQIMQQWIRDWLDLAAAWRDVAVLITTFEEMVSAPVAFERRILDFFQCKLGGGAVFGNLGSTDRFRNGHTSEWRDAYSPALIDWLASKADRNLYERMKWEI